MAPRLVVPGRLQRRLHCIASVFGVLRERCDVAIYTTPFTSVDEAVGRIGDAEIIVANRERTPLHAEVLTGCHGCA